MDVKEHERLSNITQTQITLQDMDVKEHERLNITLRRN